MVRKNEAFQRLILLHYAFTSTYTFVSEWILTINTIDLDNVTKPNNIKI